MRNFSPLAILPAPIVGLGKEILRHLLKRPVCGLAVVGRTRDGRLLLIRRGDTGTWALPGGTIEWGETLLSTFQRELEEEAGVVEAELTRLVGVFSRPDRDPRFHAVTVVVSARVSEPVKPPMNSLEIREVRLFEPGAVPAQLAMSMSDYLAAEAAAGPAVVE